MTTSTVLLDTTQYVRVNSGYNSIMLQAHRDSVRIVQSDAKPALSNASFFTLGAADPVLSIPVVDVNVWALAVSTDSKLVVIEPGKSIAVRLRDDHIGSNVDINPHGRLAVTNQTRICGTLFEGAVKDTSLWREAVSGAAAVTQAKGEVLLTTGATANGAVLYHTVEKGRFIAGSINLYRFVGFFVDSPLADNERRIGVGAFASYTPAATDAPTNGYGFYVNGTEFGVWYRSLSLNPAGIVRVPSGQFSSGKTYSPSATAVALFEIEYGHEGVYFFIDEELYHFQPAGVDILSDTVNFHAFAQNINRNGLASNVSLMVHVNVIMRYGEDATTPVTRRVPGATTAVLKTGPGSVHSIINAIKQNASTVTIWDGITGAPPSRQMLTIDAQNFQGSLDFHSPFRDGLTVVTDNAGNDLTFIFE